MSKRGYISRYLFILKKLRSRQYTSFQELSDYLGKRFEYLQMQDDTLSIGWSKRTLQRDIREIRNIFGIEILYSKAFQGYYISEAESEPINFQRIVEAFEVFNSLNLAQDLAPFIYLENRRQLGTENLYGLLHAIKNRFEIKFLYEKYWDDDVSQRSVAPYALKEFKNRWYVLARDKGDGVLKSFALDRLTRLEITSTNYHDQNLGDISNSYRYCFGIICPIDERPEDIILSFKPLQGKYIKSLPLHDTQEILIDNGKEFRIKLKLYLTPDFIMELLSFGETVRALQPQYLIDELKQKHKSGFKQY